MKKYQYNENMPRLKKALVTLGNFDGVHLGHQKIILELIDHTKKLNGNAVVITFDKHPFMVMRSNHHSIEILTTLDEKIEMFKKLGVETTILIPFTKEFAEVTPENFLQEILLKRLEIIEFVAGSDHAFGRERKGDIAFLKKSSNRLGFRLHVVDPVQMHKGVISSTKIRQYLLQGKIRCANEMLGRNYSLCGVVKSGKGLLGKMGIPTANLSILHGEYKLLPRNGIYAMLAYLNKTFFHAVGYIGTCPTMNGKQKVVEIHLHQFQGNLYDQEIKVEFIDFIREERKFESIENMVAEIKKDKEISIEILSKS